MPANNQWKAEGVDTKLLRELYNSDPTAKRVFRDLAQRQRNYGEVKVDRMARRVGASRRDVIRVFRRLQDARCGQFVVGRGGWPSRFVWDVEMIEVGRYAAGEESPINPVDPSAPPEDEDRVDGAVEPLTGRLTHSFQLRPDLAVSLQLPADLTPAEAHRLADFVRTLPFEVGMR